MGNTVEHEIEFELSWQTESTDEADEEEFDIVRPGGGFPRAIDARLQPNRCGKCLARWILFVTGRLATDSATSAEISRG